MSIAGAGLTAKRGTFGDKGKLDSMLCASFMKDGTALTGSAGGLICK